MVLTIYLGGEVITSEFATPVTYETFLSKAIEIRKETKNEILVPLVELSSKNSEFSNFTFSFMDSLHFPSQFLTTEHCISVLNLTKNKFCSPSGDFNIDVEDDDILYVLLNFEWSSSSYTKLNSLLEHYNKFSDFISPCPINKYFLENSKSLYEILPSTQCFGKSCSSGLDDKNYFLFFVLIKIYQFISILSSNVSPTSPAFNIESKQFYLQVPYVFDSEQSYYIDPTNQNELNNETLDLSFFSPLTTTASSTPASYISPLKSCEINSNIFSPSPMKCNLTDNLVDYKEIEEVEDNYNFKVNNEEKIDDQTIPLNSENHQNINKRKSFASLKNLTISIETDNLLDIPYNEFPQNQNKSSEINDSQPNNDLNNQVDVTKTQELVVETILEPLNETKKEKSKNKDKSKSKSKVEESENYTFLIIIIILVISMLAYVLYNNTFSFDSNLLSILPLFILTTLILYI